MVRPIDIVAPQTPPTIVAPQTPPPPTIVAPQTPPPTIVAPQTPPTIVASQTPPPTIVAPQTPPSTIAAVKPILSFSTAQPTTRQLLAQKKSQVNTIKKSLQEVDELIRADKNYAQPSRLDGYGNIRIQTRVELLDVMKTVQYEVDILSKLCSDYNGPNCDGIAKTCKEILKSNAASKDGVYYIKPFSDEIDFKVYCDMKNGGHILFQRRIDGKVDFLRGWQEYTNGFGETVSSYWLGLRRLSKFTQLYKTSLRVDLYHKTKNKYVYATYSTFSVGAEDTQFKLTVGGYRGTAGDSLKYHNGMKFSTTDRDNDKSTKSCAKQYKGAWWYRGCHHSNLNGAYLNGAHKSYADGMEWNTLSGEYYSLEKSSMGMIEA